MQKVLEIIRRKPKLFVVLSVGYLLVVGFAKWYIHPPLTSLWFLLGGVIGIYLFDATEVFLSLHPSPIRSIVFAGAFVIVSFFIISSSNNLLAQGLVISLYLTLLLWQIGEWQITGNLHSWYKMVAGPVSVSEERWGLLLFAVLFALETYLFLT